MGMFCIVHLVVRNNKNACLLWIGYVMKKPTKTHWLEFLLAVLSFEKDDRNEAQFSVIL